MAVKVAINGFGRIGRLAFRHMFGAPGFEIAAINDLAQPKMLAHLLKYDSTQGKYNHDITYDEKDIFVDGQRVRKFAEPDAANIPWGEVGVDVVLECTGFYTSKEKSQKHIQAGAKKVIISAPAGNDLPTIVYNVNHQTLKASDTIISAASCTTNCLAPMADALNKLAPIESGIMTTIHAYTGDQMTLDGPQRKGDLRRSRAAAINIVPNSTGAAKAIGLVIPELKGKLSDADRLDDDSHCGRQGQGYRRGNQRGDEEGGKRILRLQRGGDCFHGHHRHGVRVAFRRDADDGQSGFRRSDAGAGRFLVR